MKVQTLQFTCEDRTFKEKQRNKLEQPYKRIPKISLSEFQPIVKGAKF